MLSFVSSIFSLTPSYFQRRRGQGLSGSKRVSRRGKSTVWACLSNTAPLPSPLFFPSSSASRLTFTLLVQLWLFWSQVNEEQKPKTPETSSAFQNHEHAKVNAQLFTTRGEFVVLLWCREGTRSTHLWDKAMISFAIDLTHPKDSWRNTA